MTEPVPDDKAAASNEGPRTLDYMAPRDDPYMQRERRRQRVTGGVASCLTVLVSVFVFILSILRLYPYPPKPPHMLRNALIVPVSAFVLLTSVTLWQHFGRKHRWFIQGVLLGFGVAALIEGACFAVFRR